MTNRGGQDCDLKGNAAVVLAWVALEGHADRRRVSAVLWPESEDRQARNNLRVLAHRINHRFGGELLVGAELLALDHSQAQVELHDAEAVLAALQTGGAARCELLAEAGLCDDAGEDLQAWLAGARQRLNQMQLAQLDQALTDALAAASPERAIALAKASVQLDPLSEHRHRRLMEVLNRGGDRAAALAAYEECKVMLRQHLGILPGLETRSVQLRILQEQAQGSTQGARPVAESDPLATLGGAARYRMVEREAVLAKAQAALATRTHVVVQGEPGVGKTRLLRHLAAAAGAQVEPVRLRSALKHEPYAAVAQLLQELQPRRQPCIGVPEQVELARLAPLAFAGVKPSESALSVPRLHAALAHWLARLGDAGVQLLVIDDVQYADAASQAALASVLHGASEADDPPATAGRAPALLLSHRSGEIDAVLDNAVTDAQTRRRARRIELPRLSQEGVLTLLRTMNVVSQAAGPEALAEVLHRRTGGNPLFVIELAQQAAEGGEADTANLQALLDASLKGCGAMAQQLATVAAVAADVFTVELAAAVMGQTALGLMPPWKALQQRGLFAGHGLAHDLVQSAVLAELPQAILQQLHRQVAHHLEDQGVSGAVVLRHWLAAGDADRALPHAAQQLCVSSAAGLQTHPQELELLGLLERSSDAGLMGRLWLSAEIANSETHDSREAQVWSRLKTLRQRVEKLPPQGTSASWVAFETAREHFFLDQSVEGARAMLAMAANTLPEHGAERAYVEHALAGCAVQLRGDPRVHIHRARTALSGLPEQLPLARIRKLVETAAAIFLDPVEGVRFHAARRRAGRRRGDIGLVADACAALGYIQGAMGSHSRSIRHFCQAAAVQPGASDLHRFPNRFLAGIEALNAGHYALSQRLLGESEDATHRAKVPVLLSLMQLRLGELPQAVLGTRLIDLEPVRRDFPVLLVHAHLCAELDQFEGLDPRLGLQQRLQQMLAMGMGSPLAELMAWELHRRTPCPASRLDAGEAVLAAFRRTPSNDARHLPLLLDVAEARAEAQARGSGDLAHEAARLLRRGSTYLTLYVPEGLLRCARLLHTHDAHEALALLQVARRWVRRALEQVPQGSRSSFVSCVAVNRLLLGTDERALLTQPLR